MRYKVGRFKNKIIQTSRALSPEPPLGRCDGPSGKVKEFSASPYHHLR